MTFFANLEPIVRQARASGSRVCLLAHSMGNWALQAAVESWFSHGNGDAPLFDEAILAAADERYDSFDFPEPGRISALHRLAQRISIYFSGADSVLAVSMAINLGAKRIGQDGPHDRANTVKFPATSTVLSTVPAFGITPSTSPARISTTAGRPAFVPTSPAS